MSDSTRTAPVSIRRAPPVIVTVTAVGLVLIGVVAFFIHRATARSDGNATSFRTVHAVSSRLRPALIERGLLKAYRDVLVFSTFSGEVERMVPEGTPVKKGDPIIWFRTDDLEDKIDTITENLIGDTATLKQKQRQYLIQREQYDLQVRAAETNLRIAKINLEKICGRPLEIEPFDPLRWARNTLFGVPEIRRIENLKESRDIAGYRYRRAMANVDSLRTLYDKGFVSELKLKNLELTAEKYLSAFQTAQQRYRLALAGPNKARRRRAELDVRRKALALEKIRFQRDADLEIARQDILRAQIEVDRSVRERNGKLRKRKLAVIRAPIDGKVAFVDIWKGSKESLSPLQIGEQRRRNSDLCRVADDSVMRVRLLINEIDVPKIRVGMKADIRLPALNDADIPLKYFPGEVAEIAPKAQDRNAALGSLALRKSGEAFVKVVEVFVDFKLDAIPEQYRIETRRRLRRGMSAEVRLELDPLPEGVIVPLSAIWQPPPRLNDAHDSSNTGWVVVLNGKDGYTVKSVRIVTQLEDQAVIEGIDADTELIDDIARYARRFKLAGDTPTPD